MPALMTSCRLFNAPRSLHENIFAYLDRSEKFTFVNKGGRLGEGQNTKSVICVVPVNSMKNVYKHVCTT